MKKHFRLPLMFLVLLLACSFLSLTCLAASPPKNQLVKEDSYTMYYDAKGNPVKNRFITLKSKTYYFDKKGHMKQDTLFTYRNNTYYADASGVIAKYQFVRFEDGTKFFFDKDGKRVTGWVDYHSHTFYCPESGKVFRDCWKKIGSYYYYFRHNGYIAKNSWVDGYYINSKGHRVGTFQAEESSAKKKVISMQNIRQNPELPTGCESVALTMVLKYYHYPVSKTTIASSYMPRSSSNFVTAFMGNPFSYAGCGIYAPGLTLTANKYLTARKSSRKAHDITGAPLSNLYPYIDADTPVIVWNSMYMRTPHAIYSYYYDHKTWYFYSGEHCVVLCGYDKKKNKVLINDPLSGLVWRDADAFERIYNKLGKMAVVLTKE